MVGRSYLDVAELLSDFENTRVIRRHDHPRQAFRLLTAFDDVLNQRFSSNKGQGFAGETCGSVSGWNDPGNFHPPFLSGKGGQCTRKATQVGLGLDFQLDSRKVTWAA